MTAALNAANERANELFRGEKLSFLGIARAVDSVMERHKADLTAHPSLEDIVNVDQWGTSPASAARVLCLRAMCATPFNRALDSIVVYVNTCA